MRVATLKAQKRYALLVAAGFVCALPFGGSHAADRTSFVIPASENEGYGIGECLRGGAECGRVIADSWCESHGLGKAIAFGSADDVTGTVAGDAAPKVANGDTIIRCGE